MKAVRFTQYGSPAVLCVREIATPKPKAGEALVRIDAAAINPSDVKNVAGAFKTTLPRTPGRDYAGTVVDGDGVGRRVWGSGRAFGVERDGSHAEFVVVPSAWLSDKPRDLTMEEAAAIGVPFIVALAGLREAALKAGETVLVTGARGAVGRAVSQVARSKGARVIGVDREDLIAKVKTESGGEGVDVAFDAVGGPLFEQSLKSLRVGGRQIAIASVGERRVSFDLIDFYHRQLRLVGVDTLKFDGRTIATIMDALKPGFESGAFKPYPITVWPLEDAVAAYSAVERGAGLEKQILVTSYGQ